MSTLTFDHVTKRFGKVVAVNDFSITVEHGEFLVLLGPSGCGKTTAMRMVAALEEVTEGSIFIDDDDVTYLPPRKRNVSMIFQNYALFPHKTIFDNVAFGLKYRNVSKEDVKAKVTQALEMVRLPGVENRMPSQLSGGEQQSLTIAR